MSAARLAAEAAFGAPLQALQPVLQAQVTVRKARQLDPADEPAALAPAPAEGATEASAKAPRIFRVDAVRLSDPEDPRLVEASDASQVPGSHDMPAVPRRRHRSPDKRPGPVLHVVQAAAAPAQTLEPMAPAEGSFTIVDPRFAAEWQRLSRLVDGLQRDLRARRG